MRAEDIARALACGRSGCSCGRRAGRGWVTHCPAHNDVQRPNLNVGDADGKLLVHCFAGCAQDAVIAALRERGLWPGGASGGARRSKAIVTRYEVRDAQGTLVAVHERQDRPDGSKALLWRQPDGTLGLNGAPVSSLPLYGSEKLATQPKGNTVLVTEGEKAAEALSRRGILAVATVTGANETPCPDSLAVLLPYRAILWPDADDGGQKHMARVAQRLSALGHERIYAVAWAGAPPKGDAADFTGDDAELHTLLESAAPYEPPQRVDLATLLDEVRAFVRLYVVLTDAQADAVTLWTAHTHAFNTAEATPYLSVTSPEKRSGKTRLLEVLSLLVARPWLTGRVTAAVLVRKIAAQAATLLLDESDGAFKAEKEYAEVLRAVLNAGHRKGGVASLCVKRGGDFDLIDFPVFGPKAIAGIGKLPDTILDRAVQIAMKRRAPGERVSRFRWREAKAQAENLRDGLTAWADDSVDALRDARPDIPSELDDRAGDGWEPLLALSDMAGGEWSQRARGAALALSVGDAREDDSLGVLLLRDIKEVFENKNTDRVATADLVAALVGLEESPWSDLKGKPLNTRGLGWRLRQYGIKARTIRTGSVARGYRRDQFEDAWICYLVNTKDDDEDDDSPTPGKSDTTDTSVTPDRNGVTVVTDVTVSPGVHEQEACTVRDSAEIDGYTPAAEPRCAGHFLQPTDGPLVRFAVEQLGLPILGRHDRDKP